VIIPVLDSYLWPGVTSGPGGGHPYAYPMAKNNGGRKGLIWVDVFVVGFPVLAQLSLLFHFPDSS
jgi:hypothetical protein